VVWREVLLTQSTREMKDAMADADQGDLDRARTRLLNSKQRLESSPHAQDPEYVERCHELDRLADMLRDQQEYSAHGRKSLHSSHGHYSRHKPHTRGGILQPALRKRLAVAQRLVFVTGPGLAPTRRPDRFDGVPIEGIERPARDERELARQWGWMRDRQVLAVQARGGGHEAIARMAGHGRWDDVAVVTSSYDGLHGYGVSRHVEVYGSVWRGRCPADGRVWGANLCGTASPEKAHAEAVVHDGVPRCACGAALRPDVVWEGEDVPSGTWDAAVAAVASADAVITAGTRLSTPPMRELIRHARGPVVGIGTIRGDAPEWAEAWVPMHAQGGLEALEAEITWC